MVAKKAQMRQEFANKLSFLADRATEALKVFSEPGFSGAMDRTLREAVGAEEPPPEDGEGAADGTAVEPGEGPAGDGIPGANGAGPPSA